MSALLRLLKNLIGREESSSLKNNEVCIDDENANDKPYITASFFYLAIIGLIGFPMWYYTCSVTRHPLPDLSSLKYKLDHDTNDPPRVHLDVSVVDLERYDPSKNEEDRLQISDSRTENLRSQLNKFELYFDDTTRYNISWRIRRPLAREHEMIAKHLSKLNQQILPELEVDLAKIHKPVNKFRLFMYLVQKEHFSKFCGTNFSGNQSSFTIGFERFVFICPATEESENYDSLVTTIRGLITEMYVSSIEVDSSKHVKRGELDLLLTLIPDPYDQSGIKKLTQLATSIHQIYQRNLNANFLDLREVVNIRLIVQNIVDLLTLEARARLFSHSKTNNETSLRYINIDTFDKLVRDFEVRTSKHSTQNVYNAILLDFQQSDVKLEFTDKFRSNLLQVGDSTSVLLVNDDKSLLLGFRSLVRRIVGLKGSIPRNVFRRNIFFCRWEMDALIGFLTIRKLRETLNSLVSIGQQVVGVRIPKEVADMATEANILALKAIERLRTKQSLEAYRLASRALGISDAAYYDPSLMESLYFPDELKYAIYLPLFLPLVLPLVMSIYRIMIFLGMRTSVKPKQKIN